VLNLEARINTVLRKLQSTRNQHKPKMQQRSPYDST
jgi:hypothetical protein